MSQDTVQWEVQWVGTSEGCRVAAPDWVQAAAAALGKLSVPVTRGRLVFEGHPPGGHVSLPDGRQLEIYPHREDRKPQGRQERLLAACASALSQLQASTKCESGAVLLVDGEFLRFVVASGPRAGRLRGVRLPATQGIAGYALQTHRIVVETQGNGYNRYNRQVDSLTGYRTRSILAAPIVYSGRGYGVLEVLNPVEPFSSSDKEEAKQLARQLGRLFSRQKAPSTPRR